MILLDENLPESQRLLLRGWRIRVRQVGHDVVRKGIKDDALITLYARTRKHDLHHERPRLLSAPIVHPSYCLVCLDVVPTEAASFVRRFRRHPRFRTERSRLGAVLRVSHRGIGRLASDGTDELIAW
jgi:hypothetical protein